MKLKPIALAIAALSAGVANAAYTDTATNLYMTGASASRNNVAVAIKKLCADAGGSLTVYKNGSSTSSLANQMAYECTAAMKDSTGTTTTGITTVFHTVTGGSLNSILGMSNDDAKQQVPVSLALDPDGAGPLTGCSSLAVAGSGALTGYTVRHSCALEASPSASDGGLSDLEFGPVIEQVEGLTTGVDGFTLADVAGTQGFTSIAQAFGVGVSEKMYKDLQAVQGIIGKAFAVDLNLDGDTLDAGETGVCASGTSYQDCQPSLSRADIASLINSNGFAAQKNGAEALGLTAGASIEYARRVSTSGTQGTAQVYFLGKGCLKTGEFDIAGGNTETTGTGLTLPGATKYTYSVNSGTGDVIARLNAAGDTGYAFGLVSAENRAPTTTTGWKFVKLNGVAISDGTSTGLNKQNAIDGKYDNFVETVSYKGPASKSGAIPAGQSPGTSTAEGTLIDSITAKMAKVVADGGPVTVGLFIIPENSDSYTHAVHPTEVSLHQRGGSTPNSCQPLATP